MRVLMFSALALGVAVAGCSSSTPVDNMTNMADTDNGMDLNTQGATIPAPATSQENQLAMGNAQMAVANDNANRVFFALDSAVLSDAAKQHLDKIADDFTKSNDDGIDLSGYTDTTGTRPYNKKLSAQRAQVVKAYLETKGVAANKIATDAEGETDLNVPTANGVKEPANRRVRIEIGDQ